MILVLTTNNTESPDNKEQQSGQEHASFDGAVALQSTVIIGISTTIIVVGLGATESQLRLWGGGALGREERNEEVEASSVRSDGEDEGRKRSEKELSFVFLLIF